MARHAQPRLRRLAAAIIGSAAMLLVIPSGAWAGSAHHGKCRHGHRGAHFSTAGHHYGVHKGHRGYGRHRGHWGYGNRHGYRNRHHDRYYCEPCGRYFGVRDALYGHVSDYHGVPSWQLSFAIANHAFGLTFYG